MTTPTDEVRKALLALYASIDAEGGADPSPGEEGADFTRGYLEGLEMALLKIDEMLNTEPDEAWISEGWARFKARMDAEGLQ